MTPERRTELFAASVAIDPSGLEVVDVCSWDVGALTHAELRALLAIAQRAGETCEWVREDWANFKGAQFQTNCGRTIHAEHDRSRPCWCGRTVAVRNGRT